MIAVATYEKRGRPATQQPPSKITYQIAGQIGSLIHDPHRQQKTDRKSCFIVATNELDEAALSDEDVMESYLKKQQKVERGFRFLKEHRIRESLKAHQQTVPYQKGHPTDHPTARWVFQFFTGIHLLVRASMGEIVLNLKAAHQTLLAVLGEHFVALYADSG